MCKFLFVILLFVISGGSYADTIPADTFPMQQAELDEIIIVEKKHIPLMRDSNSMLTIDIKGLDVLPRFLGTVNPMRYLQTLSGVQTNSETTAGIYIQGCDDYHTILSINGAPIYYPNHLLGLFSPFISAHFQSMNVEKSAHSAIFPNRLGGGVELVPNTNFERTIGVDGNIGLIGAEITVPMSIGKKSDLFLSARLSYIELLYSNLLNFGGYQSNYDFQDFNATYSYRPTDSDELTLSAYYGMDRLDVNDSISTIDIGVRWSNLATSLSWQHQFGNASWRTQAHFSGFKNFVDVNELLMRVNASSALASAGVKSDVEVDIRSDLKLVSGLEYNLFFNNPLSFLSDGVSPSNDSVLGLKHLNEISLFVDYKHFVSKYFHYAFGLRPSLWLSADGQRFAAISPRLSLDFPLHRFHSIKLHGGVYFQALHKAGLSDGGLPTDFFFLSDRFNVPESAHSLSLAYNGEFINRAYSLSVELYFKQLHNVVESTSNILEMLNTGFDYQSGLLVGKGRNYGLNLMFCKNKGYLKGYVSYTLGWAMRNFDSLADGYVIRARHDRRHNLVVVLNSQLSKRWSVGAMFVLASGAPYTEPQMAYLLNGRVMYEFGVHNGASMPLYHRLDLSANYSIIKSQHRELGLNLSLYNVYAHKNVQFVLPTSEFSMREVSFFATIIPSLSFFFSF